MQFRSTDHLILSQSDIFYGLDVATLISILDKSMKIHSKKKDQLFLHSQSNKSVYFILFGCVKIISTADDGRERISDVLGVGDIFGEMTVLHDGPSCTSVVTLAPSVFMIIDKSSFIELINSNPKMALHLLRIFSKRIEHKDGLLNDLFFTDVNSRLAKHLLSLTNITLYKKFENDGFGREPNDNRRGQASTVIKISQQELANMVGVTRESVNKHLKEWERNGIVSLSTGLIDICDVDGLGALTGKNKEKL